MKKQAEVYYSGQVQGIGFRFTAERLAGEMGITGWVSNLSDGRVELVAEANEDTLKDFIAQINNIFKRYIQDIQTEWKPATGAFKDFGVKF
jgi:acylphosphatase